MWILDKIPPSSYLIASTVEFNFNKRKITTTTHQPLPHIHTYTKSPNVPTKEITNTPHRNPTSPSNTTAISHQPNHHTQNMATFYSSAAANQLITPLRTHTERRTSRHSVYTTNITYYITHHSSTPPTTYTKPSSLTDTLTLHSFTRTGTAPQPLTKPTPPHWQRIEPPPTTPTATQKTH